MDGRRFFLAPITGGAVCCVESVTMTRTGNVLLVDDFVRDDLVSRLGTAWRGVSDRVMGGISQETVALTTIDGRRALRLSGEVRLENNGGFIQAGIDLAPARQTLDASGYRGVVLIARGNGESYGVHLRTPLCIRPWQSFRAGFVAGPEWREIRLSFGQFTPYRLTALLDIRYLRRFSLVAIGRAFRADLAVSEIGFFE